MSIPRSLERGLDVLAYVLAHPGGAGFGEIGRALGLPNATTSRLLTALCGLEYLEKEGRRYRAGLRLAHLGAHETAEAWLRRQFLPRAEALAGQTGRTVVLVQWTGLHAICLERVRPAGGTAMMRRGYVPRDVLAAPWSPFFLSRSAWRREIRAAGLAGRAATQVARRWEVERLRLRSEGFTYGHTGERQRVAAPLRDPGGSVIGALALGVGPPFVDARTLSALGRRVRSAARPVT